MNYRFIPLCIALTLTAGSAITSYAQNLAAEANTLIRNLSEPLKERMLFSLNDEERMNFHFVPRERKGINFHDLNESQQDMAFSLIRSSLSDEGLRKTTEIMALENVLYKIENNRFKWPDGSPGRDPLNYFFSIFGTPSDTGFWGWRFEGHHISLNFMLNDNQIVSSTPSFFGTNPAKVDVEGFDKIEVLKLESDLGFRLLGTMSDEQMKIVRFSEEAPEGIFSGANRTATALEPRGILYPSMTQDQQEIFMDLLNVYIDNYELGFSKRLRAKIEAAGIDNLSFSWAGSLTEGSGHYYRIQGPSLLIEFDNTQNNANHIHSVVRDLTNDFAEDLLKQHYENHH
ncbi:DUF3500 domain-containing protein [Fulvivirga sedimenti]|uniref:DUF3500 domain-containing protein n=1 Tax=Fulvivirga sedimenti TaxID=2879465 RepID=A0A9X1KWU2_9BACT|nr:DUF3500 domain-containing protein [Fulvivirga sedimenti]MCA6075116.1 DUF3500 domain-containing protein [Fulvivirga sedimenti]MCA6076293.1 DUF3500 domain-containing protein [Fulvivirga sedimenti]MCA6077421.1 DUF3500 domain-containing protein [Fulvivirga sedimenti]